MKKWMILLAAVASLSLGCDGESACETEGVYQCDGDTLQVCTDGAWEIDEECPDSDMICHDMGDDSHCMLDGEMR